jgi:hypothetical protein
MGDAAASSNVRRIATILSAHGMDSHGTTARGTAWPGDISNGIGAQRLQLFLPLHEITALVGDET